MAKSADAFRTISEVAEWLETPAHVLRFWESKFTPVKPVKRAGGRRYYRPQDMRLLGGIKKLLHDDGLTIKSVQGLLRKEGVAHVAALSQPLPGEAVGPTLSAQVLDFPETRPEAPATMPPPDGPSDTAARPDGADSAPAPDDDPDEAPAPRDAAPDSAPGAEQSPQADPGSEADTTDAEPAEPSVLETPEPATPEPDMPEPDMPEPDMPEPDMPEPDMPEPVETRGAAEGDAPPLPFAEAGAAPPLAPDAATDMHGQSEAASPDDAQTAGADSSAPDDDAKQDATAPAPVVAAVAVPADPDDTVTASPGPLSALAALPRPLRPRQRRALRPFLDRLQARLDAPRQG